MVRGVDIRFRPWSFQQARPTSSTASITINSDSVAHLPQAIQPYSSFEPSTMSRNTGQMDHNLRYFNVVVPPQTGSAAERNFPAIALEEYLEQSHRFLDADRFAYVPRGNGDDEYLDVSRRRLSQWGVWLARWRHQSMRVLDWPTVGYCDLPFARIRSEMVWQARFSESLRRIDRRELRYESAETVDCPRTVDSIDRWYYVDNWDRWARELAFERRMRNRPEASESVFASWISVELFAIPIQQRDLVFTLVEGWWTDTVEIAPVYATSTPWVHIYHTASFMAAKGHVLNTLNRVAVSQFLDQALPVILATARRGTYAYDFCDPRLGLKQNELSIAVIGPLSPLAWRCYHHWGIAATMSETEEAARNLLVFRRIDEIDWDASFAGIDVRASGRFFPYDYATGTVSALPAGSFPDGQEIPAVEVRYRDGCPEATVQTCQAEVDNYRARTGATDRPVTTIPEMVSEAFRVAGIPNVTTVTGVVAGVRICISVRLR